jgi:hypothetical protein
MRDARMAVKRPQHRETTVLHFGNGDHSDPIITEEEIEHAKARERREAKLRGLTSRMRRMRQSGWRSLDDIAKNYNLGREADLYRTLLADIRSGKFDEFGLWFLNPDPRAPRRLGVTRAMVENMVEIFGSDINDKNPGASPIVVQFLRHCWMPNALYRQFFAHDLRSKSADSAAAAPSEVLPEKEETRGRKSKYDWKTYEPMFYERMDKMGDFDDDGQVPEWDSQGDAENWLLETIENEPDVGKGNGPGATVVRDHVRAWTAYWRKTKRVAN